MCSHSKYVGIVTSHPDRELKSDDAHAAKSVCARPECIEKAKAWVENIVGYPGTFRPFGGVR